MSFVEQPIGHAAAHRAEADKSHVSHKLAVLLLSATRYHMLTDGEIGVVTPPMETTVTTHSTAAPAAARRKPFYWTSGDKCLSESSSRSSSDMWFNVDMMQKGMNLAIEMGHTFPPAARGMGRRAQDFAVMFDVRAGMSGVSR
jgi:hypothetical protein